MIDMIKSIDYRIRIAGGIGFSACQNTKQELSLSFYVDGKTVMVLNEVESRRLLISLKDALEKND